MLKRKRLIEQIEEFYEDWLEEVSYNDLEDLFGRPELMITDTYITILWFIEIKGHQYEISASFKDKISVEEILDNTDWVVFYESKNIEDLIEYLKINKVL